ncbi:hypothetical protein [Nocardiopsis sp. JB363]|uniref:hypothetical protein n=1 Tax=Nocardiopsis sp. JB363 TaxID=1434837 RepID=UPI000979D6CD|nr:hypothetical protein [Nocardiopsis sp. JB363]SIO90657.1 hypothetical protein BQ8420_27780 [Nocardiopsis sp. JB363]
MYDGPPQGFPQAASAPMRPRRSTGRTVAITVAATLGAYVLVVGVAGAVIVGTGSGASGAGNETEGLPSEPCSAGGGSQLGALSASMPNANFGEARSTCQWWVEYSDGTPGVLFVRYRFATDDDERPLRDESDAQELYETESERLLDGDDSDYWSVEVSEARELELGDESVVSHYQEGSDDMVGNADVLVRVGDVLVSVEASEAVESPEHRTGRVDFTEDEETLIAMAEHAVTLVE